MVNDPSQPSSNNKCWNCGELDCNVMTCPKPKDESRIAASQKLFYHQKRQDREASKSTKATPKTPKLSLLLGVFQSLARTTKGSFMDVHAPTILQNQVRMKMKFLQVGLPHLNHLSLLMMITPFKPRMSLRSPKCNCKLQISRGFLVFSDPLPSVPLSILVAPSHSVCKSLF